MVLRFHHILVVVYTLAQVVGMTADEYASQELQQWREAEAKKDIDAIKVRTGFVTNFSLDLFSLDFFFLTNIHQTHELDMLALGNTFVMKTHKGEQVGEEVMVFMT